MNIEEIREFANNKDAWYHVIVPDDTSDEEIMVIGRTFDDSQISGTVVVTRQSTKIRDITEYMTKHRLKDIGT